MNAVSGDCRAMPEVFSSILYPPHGGRLAVNFRCLGADRLVSRQQPARPFVNLARQTKPAESYGTVLMTSIPDL